MSRFAVTAVGTDRPGIVATVTGALMDRGCNLQDTAMSILGGCFAMMLVVEFEPANGAADLESALAPCAADLDLLVMVRPIADVTSGGSQTEAGDRTTVSVYGADHPGIVHGVARLLADRDVNIIDLTTRVAGKAESSVYAMVIEVEIPPAADHERLTADLAELAKSLGVSAQMHPSEADIL